MHRIRSSFAILAVSFVLLQWGAARAMTTQHFDQLSGKQRGEYAVFLIESAAKLLATQGNQADAARVRDLFESEPGQGAKPALQQFMSNIKGVGQLNQQHAGDPNFKPYEVEHALALTLKQNGIIVPVSKLLQAGLGYKPANAS
jgi:hypothetical protein